MEKFIMNNEDIILEVSDMIPIPGPAGENGATFTPYISEEGIISWTNDKDLPNPESRDIKGPQGQDGVSPSITVTQITDGHEISITDATSTQTFNVIDGKDGQPGSPGTDGQDGVSPEVNITQITGGYRVTITDKDHPSGQSFDVMNGQKGSDGKDGVSPSVTVTHITGGYQISITDATSTQTFNIMNGIDGQDGSPGTPGVNGATFTPSVSSAGVISWTNDQQLPNPQSVDLVAAVLAALPTWQGGEY